MAKLTARPTPSLGCGPDARLWIGCGNHPSAHSFAPPGSAEPREQILALLAKHAIPGASIALIEDGKTRLVALSIELLLSSGYRIGPVAVPTHGSPQEAIVDK